MSQVRFASVLVAVSITAGLTMTPQRAFASILPPVSSGTLRMHLVADASNVTKDGSNLVSYWNDSASGSVNDFGTSGAAQPLWVSKGLAGLPVIRFDGVNDQLYSVDGNNLSTANMGSAFTFFVTLSGGTGNPKSLFASNAGSANLFRFGSGNNQVEIWNQDPVVPVTYNTGGTVLAVRFSAGYPIKRNLDVLNLPIFSGTPTTTSATGTQYGGSSWRSDAVYYNVRIGYDPGYFAGDIHEMVLYSGKLSDADRDAVAQAMQRSFMPKGTVITIQ